MGGSGGGGGGTGGGAGAIIFASTASFFADPADTLAGTVARSFANAFTRARGFTAVGDSLTAAGLTEGAGIAEIFGLGFGSSSFFAAEILMSATFSFCTSANPYDVSIRKASFSYPTIVP